MRESPPTLPHLSYPTLFRFFFCPVSVAGLVGAVSLGPTPGLAPCFFRCFLFFRLWGPHGDRDWAPFSAPPRWKRLPPFVQGFLNPLLSALFFPTRPGAEAFSPLPVFKTNLRGLCLSPGVTPPSAAGRFRFFFFVVVLCPRSFVHAWRDGLLLFGLEDSDPLQQRPLQTSWALKVFAGLHMKPLNGGCASPFQDGSPYVSHDPFFLVSFSRSNPTPPCVLPARWGLLNPLSSRTTRFFLGLVFDVLTGAGSFPRVPGP